MDDRKRCWCGDTHVRTFTKNGRTHFSWLGCMKINKKKGLS